MLQVIVDFLNMMETIDFEMKIVGSYTLKSRRNQKVSPGKEKVKTVGSSCA